MSSNLLVIVIAFLSINVVWRANVCESRYLPTRSQEDRLSRLKELVQEVSRFIHSHLFAFDRSAKEFSIVK